MVELFGVEMEFEMRPDGLYLVKKSPPVRPRCWLDWEHTSDPEPEPEDEDDAGPTRPRCWLEGEK